MAEFNAKKVMLAGLKGDSVFIRYSANSDGTDFTETWTAGQNFIGLATGQEAPTDKSAYKWFWFGENSGGSANISVVGETLKIF